MDSSSPTGINVFRTCRVAQLFEFVQFVTESVWGSNDPILARSPYVFLPIFHCADL